VRQFRVFEKSLEHFPKNVAIPMPAYQYAFQRRGHVGFAGGAYAHQGLLGQCHARGIDRQPGAAQCTPESHQIAGEFSPPDVAQL
jgi:hypothetical protein